MPRTIWPEKSLCTLLLLSRLSPLPSRGVISNSSMPCFWSCSWSCAATSKRSPRPLLLGRSATSTGSPSRDRTTITPRWSSRTRIWRESDRSCSMNRSSPFSPLLLSENLSRPVKPDSPLSFSYSPLPLPLSSPFLSCLLALPFIQVWHQEIRRCSPSARPQEVRQESPGRQAPGARVREEGARREAQGSQEEEKGWRGWCDGWG
jgi:hypothetical protein